jgi:hypothetical protein
MARTLATTTLPTDITHVATFLVQFPPAERRARAVRLVSDVATALQIEARGLTPPVTLPRCVVSGALDGIHTMTREGATMRRWADDPADFVGCIALAAEVIADAMRGEAEERRAA